MNKKSGYTLAELLVVLVVMLIVLGIINAGCKKIIRTGEGKRVGVVTKFSNTGIFINSFEGELNMGGIRSSVNSDGNSMTIPNVWRFSCSDDAVAANIAAHLGKEVVLSYKQSPVFFIRETSYDVISVEPIK